MRASVRLANDALERDNVFNFVVSPDEPVRVILAERAGAPRDGSLYLSRALAVGESPRFEVTARSRRLALERGPHARVGRRPERCRGRLVDRRSSRAIR